MADHIRAADDALISIARELGEVKGRQDQILESQKSAVKRQDLEDKAHSDIHAELRLIKSRLADVPQESHNEHHQFIGQQIAAYRERAAMCKQVKTVFIERWLPYALLALIAFAMYTMGLKEYALNLLGKLKL